MCWVIVIKQQCEGNVSCVCINLGNEFKKKPREQPTSQPARTPPVRLDVYQRRRVKHHDRTCVHRVGHDRLFVGPRVLPTDVGRT